MPLFFRGFAMNDSPNDDLPIEKKVSPLHRNPEGPRLGRRLVISASLAVPTFLTLGKQGQAQVNPLNSKQKKKGSTTMSELASVKKRKIR
jgi:hypothetical protein